MLLFLQYIDHLLFFSIIITNKPLFIAHL